MYSSIKITCLILAFVASVCESQLVVPRNETDSGPCRNFTNQNILKELEELRSRMHLPIPRFNVPPLDPMRAEEITLSDLELLAGVEIVMQNVSFTGFSGFVINDLDLSLLHFNLTLELVIPSLNIFGWHRSNGSLFDLIPVNGEGQLNLTIVNLTINAAGPMNHTGTEWDVPELSLNMTIDAILGPGFGNLTDNFFNELLMLSGPEILELAWPGLQPTVEEAVAGAATTFLNGFTVHELMRMVMGGGIDWSDVDNPTTVGPTTVPPTATTQSSTAAV